MQSSVALDSFHPAVRCWFNRRFPKGASEPQTQGWPAIALGRDTLIAAPTGTGKTLSAFLVCIDRLFRAAERFERFELVADGGVAATRPTEVVYVSPLKALAADIEQNLQGPLSEIRQIAEELGYPVPEVRVALRTGDTPSSQRAAMLRKPPHLLVTTPESLYLMVTAERSREMLRGVRTVIIDEIHAVARDKRGSHLALTLERLDELCLERPVRIGLSATQRPIETMARFLVGAGPERDMPDGRPRCEVVDVGHQRDLQLSLELPGGELEAVASGEQMNEVLDQIAVWVGQNRTTLIFVNQRRMAERLAHNLAEKIGDHAVAAHHGSLSRERRLRVEARLRAGDLKALVATASLELGIDVGPIDLVCQIGSPRSLSTFIQRVGRSGHYLGGKPVGRLFPLTRDELIECAALLRGVRAGRLDAIHPPEAPLDILAQQIVAACGGEDWREDDLFNLMRRAAPYASLQRKDFDDVVELLSEGITTGRGRRGAYLHRDRVNGVLRGRRGARLAALTAGGAIPEMADYRVIAGPSETFVGTVGEDWAIESMAGDIFLLGSTSWRIKRVESSTVRVEDAHGAPPTIPFWLGEAPARTQELSEEVSALRAGVDDCLADGAPASASAEPRQSGPEAARAWVERECGVTSAASAQIVAYLAASRTALGSLPTQKKLIFERFFDEAGGMQLVVHSPLGGRINRGLGLALRKRFCVNFNFELQAAANDDAIVLSLGPQHSFPLGDVPRFLHPNTVAEVLSQAVLVSPMFTARWRWNLNRSLTVLRQRAGKRNPPPIQRMEADDLMAAVFPGLAACQEHQTGPIEIPDHVLLRQTMHDCLHEAMDIDGLTELVKGFLSGAIETEFVDTTEPSPLCHEILSARPYTFLDDAPLEERRTRAVSLRRGLPVAARELAKLDPAAIERVRDEARPQVRDAEELHDLLLSLVLARPRAEWSGYFDELRAAGRVCVVDAAEGTAGRGLQLWCALEKRPFAEALFPGARIDPDPEQQPLPVALAAESPPDRETAARESVRGQLEISGPVTTRELCAATGLASERIETALLALEGEGFVLRGEFEEPAESVGSVGSVEPAVAGVEQFCARRLLTRIHLYTQERLRKEIEPVVAQDFIRFLLRWQHVAPRTQREGRRGVLAVIEQLQGFELPAGAWEESLLVARVDGYRKGFLDSLSRSGDIVWTRLSLKAGAATESSGAVEDAATSAGGQARAAIPAHSQADASAAQPSGQQSSGQQSSAPRGGMSPSRATPLSFLLRSDQSWLLRAARGDAAPAEPGPGAARDVLECLRQRGALFHGDIVSATGRMPLEVEEGLWELVSRGLVTADSFDAVRSLLGSRERWARKRRDARSRRGLRRGVRGRSADAADGRWALVPSSGAIEDPDEFAEAVAEQLLVRWGVVFRDLMVRETLAVPWRDLLWAFRRMEARGVIRGGRFVSGFVGEQFALPGAVEALRRTRRMPRNGEVVRLSAADPLNLVGILTPGPRIPALRTNEVIYRDGLPEDGQVIQELALGDERG